MASQHLHVNYGQRWQPASNQTNPKKFFGAVQPVDG